MALTEFDRTRPEAPPSLRPLAASGTSRPRCSGSMRLSLRHIKSPCLSVCRKIRGVLGACAESCSCASILPFSEIPGRCVSHTPLAEILHLCRFPLDASQPTVASHVFHPKSVDIRPCLHSPARQTHGTSLRQRRTSLHIVFPESSPSHAHIYAYKSHVGLVRRLHIHISSALRAPHPSRAP